MYKYMRAYVWNSRQLIFQFYAVDTMVHEQKNSAAFEGFNLNLLYFFSENMVILL